MISPRMVLLTLSLAAALAAPAAQAQSAGPGSPACRVVPEAIVSLRPPFFGTPVVWDATFGGKSDLVQFSAAVAMKNGNLLAAGESLDKDFKPTAHLLIEMNRRGRAVDEKRYPAKPAERSSGILETSGGYIVSSSMAGGPRDSEKWVRLAWYDAGRKFLREMVLKDAAFDYESLGLSRAVDGNGFLAIVHATNRKDLSDQHGMLFRVSDSGRLLWKRAYRPGIPNQIYGVSVADDRHYIAGGRIRNEDGRMAGWILKLNDDGTIVWQNTYPRGDSALFRSGFSKPADQSGDHYVLTGQVMPIGGGPGAAWVIEVDAMGVPVWQRYLRQTGYDLDGRSIRAYGDGRISVLANARAVDKTEGQQDHIRLFTMSPRGGVMEDDSYLDGQSAQASQLIIGAGEPWNGERIVTAFIERAATVQENENAVELITDALARQEKEKARAKAGAEKTYGPPAPSPEQAAAIAQTMPGEIHHEGWVFVASALDPYTDPCVLPESAPAP